jgi:hypothetical protein
VHKELVNKANREEHTLLDRKQKLNQIETDETFGSNSRYDKASLGADINARSSSIEFAEKAIGMQVLLSREEVRKNLPEYIADAKTEAEKDGKVINL